jgi:hypothetical protein
VLKIAVFRKQIVSILPEIDIAQGFDVTIGKGDIVALIVSACPPADYCSHSESSLPWTWPV